MTMTGTASAPSSRIVDRDDHLRALRAGVAEAALELRTYALAIDADPDAAGLPPDSTVAGLIHAATAPERYRPDGPRSSVLKGYRGNCLERVIATLELARGDAGALLAAPGPSLAGIVVDALGSESQREYFHRRVGDGRTHTFFAMTEAAHGSDATAMQTRVERAPDGGYRLVGGKRYIGNGARGGIGVVFGRTGRSPLSIRAVLVQRPAPGLSGRRLDTLGLRGACLSELAFDEVAVPQEMLLGEHLPPSRRGLWGALQTFNNVRIQVAAMGVGTGLAILDRVDALVPDADGADVLRARLEAAREVAYQAAAAVDRDPDPRARPAVAKLLGTGLAVAAARWAAVTVGPGGLLDDPLLEKWTRDVYGFEFMEGTGNMQRLHVADSHLRGLR